jgi:hypothetical protein
LLEEIRLLANIETNTDKLLPVVLAGQPQLSDRLNDPALKQLKQRVALRCDLQPLTLKETLAYVSRRIRIAGGDSASLFTLDALELIHRCAQGIPRTISVICDNALVTGFAAGRRPVDSELVYEVCRDFDLAPPARVPDQRARGAIWGEAPARVAPIARELLDAAGVRDAPDAGLFAWVNRRRFSFFGA